MKTALALLLSAYALCAATYTEGDFGFDAEAADNWAALKALETHFASGGDGDTVTFTNGVYTIISTGTPMIGLTNRSNVTIDGPGATFKEVSATSWRYLWHLRSCTNMVFNLNFEGRQWGDSSSDFQTNSFTALYLQDSNSNVRIATAAQQVYDVVRIGNYNAGSGSSFGGNTNIHVVTTNLNSRYGVAAYLTSGLYVTNKSEGTVAADWAAHRAVYLAGVTNATIYTQSKNLNVSESGTMLMTTIGYGGQHFGCEGINLFAEDLGSDKTTSARNFVILSSQQSNAGSWETAAVTNRNINIDLTLEHPAFNVANRYAVLIMAHNRSGYTGDVRFENVTISGTYDRSDLSGVNTNPSIYVWSRPWLMGGTMSIERFYETQKPGQTLNTLLVDGSTPVTITSCSSPTIASGWYSLATPSVQTLTYSGECDFVPPTGTRATIGGRAVLQGRIR
jgi:hypothetical protein